MSIRVVDVRWFFKRQLSLEAWRYTIKGMKWFFNEGKNGYLTIGAAWPFSQPKRFLVILAYRIGQAWRFRENHKSLLKEKTNAVQE